MVIHQTVFAQHPHQSGSHAEQVRVKSFTGTYITQDCECFRQSFTKQPDPFGKQLVQMFTEVLTDNDRGEKEKILKMIVKIQSDIHIHL